MPPPTIESADRPWESNFGSGVAFSIGVEEELLLVDPDNELTNRGRSAHAVDPVGGEVESELFKAMVESKTDISPNARAAAESLGRSRTALLESGSRLMGSGVHPTASAGSADIQELPRYRLIADALQGLLRTPICGLHVHIGMPDEETAVRAYNGIRAHVPLINALAANSPYWFGVDSGLASARTVIFRSYPRSAMAPEFEDFRHFSRVTREVCIAGSLPDYTHIWWDVRLHPRLGTIEIRAADVQYDLRRTAAIVALIHCLTRAEAEGGPPLPSREALAESTFQATRHGLDAQLLDRDGTLLPAREIAAESLVRASQFSGELDCVDELAHVETMLEEGCGADVQRRVWAERGAEGLLAYLVERTAAVSVAAG
jgi:carboxylate-amine ligase